MPLRYCGHAPQSARGFSLIAEGILDRARGNRGWNPGCVRRTGLTAAPEAHSSSLSESDLYPRRVKYLRGRAARGRVTPGSPYSAGRYLPGRVWKAILDNWKNWPDHFNKFARRGPRRTPRWCSGGTRRACAVVLSDKLFGGHPS